MTPAARLGHLLLLKGVLQPANGVLHAAFNLVGGSALGFKLGVTDDFANDLFDRAFGPFGRSNNSILVWHLLLLAR